MVDVPADCGSESLLRDRLGELVGPGAVERAMPDRVRIVAHAQDFELELAHDGRTRILRDPECATLFRSAVVIAAAAIEPSGPARTEAAPAEPPSPARASREGTEGDDASTGGASAAEKVASRVPDGSAEADPALESREAAQLTANARTRVELGAGLGVTTGVLPDPALQVALTSAITHGPLGISLALRLAWPQVERLGSGHGASILAAGGRLGLRFAPWPPLRLGFGGELTRVVASGRGGGVEDAGGAWLSGLFAELAARLGLSRRLYAELALSGRHALTRPSIEIVGQGQLDRVAVWGAEAEIRLGWIF